MSKATFTYEEVLEYFKNMDHEQAIKINKIYDALERIYLFANGSGTQMDVKTIRSLLKEMNVI